MFRGSSQRCRGRSPCASGNTPQLHRPLRGLTSSLKRRPHTAGCAGRATPWFILRRTASAPVRAGRLSSNVRAQKPRTSNAVALRDACFLAWFNSDAPSHRLPSPPANSSSTARASPARAGQQKCRSRQQVARPGRLRRSRIRIYKDERRRCAPSRANVWSVCRRGARAPRSASATTDLPPIRASRHTCAPRLRCCALTGRSRRRPATAATAWPLQAKFAIVFPRPVGVCLHGRLSSNVRPHSSTITALHRT
jgi:hypothetical protein